MSARKAGGVSLVKVIAGAAVGTGFEFFDFFVFGALSSITSKIFFASLDATAALLAALAVFAAGFFFRPIGALAFGALGDRAGRKTAFMITVVLMGGATVAMGLLPTYAQVGPLAPVLLILTRVIQGAAVGGEYGGAAIYVAEHAPRRRLGLMTAFIQSSASLGLILALSSVLATRTILGETAFGEWGWRLPFLLSVIPLGLAIWIRSGLKESPVFEAMAAAGQTTRHPYRETFGQWKNLRLVIYAMVGFMAAQGALWYTAYFYTQIFLERLMKAPPVTVNLLIMAAAAMGAVLCPAMGALSDRIGRKLVIWGGLCLAAVSFFPLFHLMAGATNPALLAAQARAPVVVTADRATCAFQFDLVGKAVFASPCDIARSTLANAGVSYTLRPAAAGSGATVSIGAAVLPAPDARGADAAGLKVIRAPFETAVKAALVNAGYPKAADPRTIGYGRLVFALFVLALCASAVYGPLAAAGTEIFPARIRYTALSLPYHLGAGWVGGFVPVVGFAIVTATGNVFAGLWYPVGFAISGAILCLPLWRQTEET